ncbi:3'(2'),5'-bisphosphate nucleotidase CysQ [Marinobacterium zhoushanense]|uniref:3'(2'),5'-bisphosphate nucleotidase CysQ n=1 Tax=Marinobacterium zhoushanense TaxID=1679163 RepID=A0ABQ1K0H9_9GAMM|nr:3'(2'),5'-bisphosphate nucleotidase CysQ [Marinobacterium zhoushanense]GGB79923.1 3'(2'),5'-bisphosphate nucleotidase CysQ [Marinobacterium zhoushanense]
MSGWIKTQLLEQVANIAREAGEAIMQVYARDFAVSYKADESPLTEADQAAHHVIVKRLAALEPRLPILSEEDVESFPGADGEGRFWLVDPLDGTKEFIKRNDDFSVNIALVEQGEPVLGVVFAPVADILWQGARGLGAQRIDQCGERAIRVREHRPGQPWRLLCSRSHPSPGLDAWIEKLERHDAVELESVGSSLKFCRIAEGTADIYPRLGPTSLWDTAAAHAVLNEAGGAVIRFDGEPLCYSDTTCLINPWFIAQGRGELDWTGF